MSGVATISEIGAVPASVRDEAESILAAVGPIRTIGLGAFTDWIEPFFIVTGSRAVSKADQDKQIDAIGIW